LELEFTHFYRLDNNFQFNKISFLQSIINLKKNVSFFKKDNKFNSVILNRFQNLKAEPLNEVFNDGYEVINIAYQNQFSKSLLSERSFKYIYNNDESCISTKNVDIKYKSLLIYKKNRELLRIILNKKLMKQFKFNKIIKNSLNKHPSIFLKTLELSLPTLLIRSSFFVNLRDVHFFIKNGFILVNNAVVTDINYILNPKEIVKIIFDKYYYFYYRKGLNDIINNITKYSSYL
jgi:ribosomal protein S4